jgi:hypothetical protein
MEKMTNVKAMDYVLENCGADLPEEVFDKLTAIKASFIKKAENRKPTATQKANEELKAVILANVTAEGATATEILTKIKAADAKYNVVTLPKLTALLTQLKDAKAVERVTDKKKALYKIA